MIDILIAIALLLFLIGLFLGGNCCSEDFRMKDLVGVLPKKNLFGKIQFCVLAVVSSPFVIGVIVGIMVCKWLIWIIELGNKKL